MPANRARYNWECPLSVHAEARRRARAAWTVRVRRLTEDGSDDLSDGTTPEERLAMTWPLGVDAWASAGKPLRQWTREEMPVPAHPEPRRISSETLNEDFTRFSGRAADVTRVSWSSERMPWQCTECLAPLAISTCGLSPIGTMRWSEIREALTNASWRASLLRVRRPSDRSSTMWTWLMGPSRRPPVPRRDGR